MNKWKRKLKWKDPIYSFEHQFNELENENKFIFKANLTWIKRSKD